MAVQTRCYGLLRFLSTDCRGLGLMRRCDAVARSKSHARTTTPGLKLSPNSSQNFTCVDKLSSPLSLQHFSIDTFFKCTGCSAPVCPKLLIEPALDQAGFATVIPAPLLMQSKLLGVCYAVLLTYWTLR